MTADGERIADGTYNTVQRSTEKVSGQGQVNPGFQAFASEFKRSIARQAMQLRG